MESNREESWIENVFEGDPPDGYKDWFDWATSKQKTGAYIRRAEPSDWGRSPRKPEWGGTGYPPIGCECEVYHYEDWRRCEILAHRDRLVLYYVPRFIRQQTGSTSGQWFRPIRTKEKKERDELMGIIGKAWSHDQVGACADAILEKYHLTERD